MKTLSVITLLFISFISGCFVSKNKADVQAQKISVINTLFNEKSATVDKKIVIFKSAIDTIAKPGLKTISQKIPPYKTLREAYINYFPVGTAITPETDLNDPKIAEFIKTQYSSLTGKQSMQPFRIHPYEDSFRWDQADMLVNFAQQNNMAVRGHCLIYSTRDKHMPAWFFKDSENIASKELVLKRMEEHITRIVSRYKGKVYCWDVVNEAVSNKKGEYLRSNDPLYKIVGEEYIAKAFEYAHAADTAAKLFYNDNFDDHSPQKRTEIYKLLKRLKDNGVPIDGIGMQCHLGISGISREYLQETIDLFKSIGLEFQITELDVSIY
ncbi:MAG: endo-1,4-beta-xylanase, partial [Ginsengibacter sp.]